MTTDPRCLPRRHRLCVLLLSTILSSLVPLPARAEHDRGWQRQDEARQAHRPPERREGNGPKASPWERPGPRARQPDWPPIEGARNGRVLSSEPRAERKRRIRVLSPDGHVRDVIIDDRDQ